MIFQPFFNTLIASPFLQNYDIISSKAEIGFDRDIQGWLKGFVKLLGSERASVMLAGVRKFSSSKQ